MKESSIDNFNTEDFNDFGDSLLENLYRTMQKTFLNYNFPIEAQRTEHIQELINHPEKSYFWHLCIMEDEKNKGQEEAESKNSMKKWLDLGMEHGWLRYIDMEKYLNPLHQLFLNQDEFWQRLIFATEHKKNHFSLVLFKLDAQNERLQLQELIEQLIISTQKQDFFGEIKGFGIALALPEMGGFTACALAERILSCVNNALPHLQINAGLAEALDGENADTIFAHAKEALLQNKQDNLNAMFYQHSKNEKKNKSLVQADEKRFLFFGV